jgi:hypothetical protein
LAGWALGELAVNTIVLPSEGLTAGVKSVASGSARKVPGHSVPANSARAVKLSAAELEREFVISLDTIHARAETVTEVLESILHSHPVLPSNML